MKMKAMPFVAAVAVIFLTVIIPRKNEAYGASIEKSPDLNGGDIQASQMEPSIPDLQRVKRAPMAGCCACGEHHCCGSMCHGK